MSEQLNEFTPDGLSRRQFIRGALAVIAGGGVLLSCADIHSGDSRQPAPQPYDTTRETDTVQPTTPELPATTSSSTSTPTETVTSKPELPRFSQFADGEFIGAATITYGQNPDRPTSEIDAYYRRKHRAKPAMNNPFVHQLVVGGSGQTDAVSDEMLAHGVVAHKIDGPITVLAMHDVTPVHAPIIVNGQSYDQAEMGVNAVVTPGDVLSLVLPDQHGQLSRFDYKAARSWVVDVHDSSATQAVTQDSAPLGIPKVRTYKCWPPGSDRQRLVDEWLLVDSSASDVTVAQGNHGQVGPAKPNL